MSTMPKMLQRVCTKSGWEFVDDQTVVSLSDGRKQTVFLAIYVDDDKDYLRCHTVIGDSSILDEVRLVAALRLNYGLKYGALGIKDDQLVMSDTFLLRGVDPDKVQASIAYMASTADRYEELIYGTDAN